ncbi:MAG: hypothetical protein HQK54_17065 [Oligoflexales bacterium]|nr:hypothetical protein [Oligoflexales bacterium]
MNTTNPKVADRVKSDKFKRDGAKYVCNKCKKKFFTREEVEKCFDSHVPKRPGNFTT